MSGCHVPDHNSSQRAELCSCSCHVNGCKHLLTTDPPKICCTHTEEDKKIEFCIWCKEELPCGCALSMVRDVTDRIEKLENEWNDSQITRKISSPSIDNTLCRFEERIEKLEEVLPRYDELHKEWWKRIEALEGYMEMEDRVTCSDVLLRLSKLEALVDLEKLQQIIFDGANLHATILKFEHRLKNATGNLIPHKCPVCDGFGKATQFIDGHCTACEGKGIVWG